MAKKPRRSQRLSQTAGPSTPVSKKQQLPSPVTKESSDVSNSSEAYKEATATPPEGRPSQLHHRPLDHNLADVAFSSPPQETQAFSQFMYPSNALSDDVEDEAKEGVWGYLIPLDPKYGKELVLRRRNACPLPDKIPNFGKSKKGGESKDFEAEEEAYEETKLKGIASGGYLIGRHPECGKLARDFKYMLN